MTKRGSVLGWARPRSHIDEPRAWILLAPPVSLRF